MRTSRILLFLLLLFPILYLPANADQFQKPHDHTGEGLPWFTGPLLAPSGEVIPEGHTNIEPYFFLTSDYAGYNNTWGKFNVPTKTSLNPLLDIARGIANRVDLEALIPYQFNSRLGRHANALSDTTLILGYQLLRTKDFLQLRITLGEVFPTGRYKNLNLRKLGTDLTGNGVYQTQIAANFQKLIEFNRMRYMAVRLSIEYSLPSSTRVSGFNAYGGGLGTNGRVYVGSGVTVDLAFEYTLTAHWVTAFDVVYTYDAPSTFSGTTGILGPRRPAQVGVGTQQSVSMAPAIEYNFNAHIGIITGVWFTVAGRNTPAFHSWVTALNLYK